MDLIKQIYILFDNFSDENCRMWNGYNPDWRPNWNEEIEDELKRIQEHSPIPLPDDYCEIFRAFGGGGIEDKRPNWAIPDISFWAWAEIEDFNDCFDFFEECPNALPIGDDIGDRMYMLIQSKEENGIYMSGKSLFWDKEYRTKIASSFTELFTDADVQRKFRNYYCYGYDKGTDGR